MRRWLIVLPTTIVAALLVAGTVSLALAQPGPSDEPPGLAVAAEHRPDYAGPSLDLQTGPPQEPPGQAVAVEHRPDDAGPPADLQQGPPEEPPGQSGEAPGMAISEAAHEKVEVTNPDGVTISPSLVGFCRSQAPWMSDKGDSCDGLAGLFKEISGGDDANGDDDNGESSSQEGDTSQQDRGPHLGQLPAFEAARASLEMARGLFAHVLSLLA